MELGVEVFDQGEGEEPEGQFDDKADNFDCEPSGVLQEVCQCVDLKPGLVFTYETLSVFPRRREISSQSNGEDRGERPQHGDHRENIASQSVLFCP